MSRSQFTTTPFAMLVIGLTFLNSPVLGQTVSSPGLVPCTEETVAGRPTLKRRHPAPDSSSRSVPGQQSPENENCGNPDILPNVVSEGPRFSIEEIRFEANRVFSSEELAARMGEFPHRDEESKNGYDAEIFDFCLRRLTNFVRGRGYLQAKLGEPTKEVTEGGLIVTVPVEEGALYRLGEIKIEGAENLTKEQVRAMLGLQQGTLPTEKLSANGYLEI